MKFFKVKRYIEDPQGEVFIEWIDEYVNVEHIVSIVGYVPKHSTHRDGYMLYLVNGKTFRINDMEYETLIKLIETTNKEKINEED